MYAYVSKMYAYVSMVHKHTENTIQYKKKKKNNYLQQSLNKSLEISDLDKPSYVKSSLNSIKRCTFPILVYYPRKGG